ncbi:MAG: ABC transporter permease [Methanoregulaceae archaeon]|nr:ABC transporter permease [Methanoregulaceae archaeon]
MNRRPWAVALALLVAVLVLNMVFTPGFFAIELRDGRLFGSLIDILNRAAPAALLALGMALVIATGGVDLSVGAVMAISGAVAAGLVVQPDGFVLKALGPQSVGAANVIAVVAGVLCGLFNGLLVGLFRIQPIVATLLLMVAGRGLAQLLTNGQIITVPSDSFATVAIGATLGLPNPVWLTAAMALFFGGLTRLTALGLLIEATGDNPTAARYVGIDGRTLRLAVYGLSGLCAGLAGVIAASNIKAADANNAGLYLELDAILAVAVGGTAMTGGRFSLFGALIGAVLMQTVTTSILTRGIGTEITLVLKAFVVVAVCLLQAPAFHEMLKRRRAPA